MLLDKYRDYFKENYKWQYPISIGKIDNNKEKMVTFYNSKRVMKSEGFINNKRTKIKPITILLKYGTNYKEALEEATKIQEFWNFRNFNIDNYQIYSNLLYSEPIELGADDDQLDFPVIYASAKNGISKVSMEDPDSDMTPLFESIITNIDAPNCDMDGTLQMLVSNIDYDDYVGRIAVGRVERGTIKKGMQVAICKRDDKIEKAAITKIEVYQGLNKVTVEEGQAGDIITLSGINNINIGETICDENAIEKIDFVDIDEPTVSMTFSVNNGPFAGKEGKFITSRHLRDRLMKEMERNISLRVKETEFPDSFEVAGRGELHLTVLIENMRREGFELIVSRPKVIMKEINGVLSEPIEKVVIDAPSETIGAVIEKMGRRKGEMIDMKPGEGDFTRVEFLIPARRTYRI